MKNFVTFRNFEVRDVDFVYRVKNDRRVIDAIGLDYTDFSYEDAARWVTGCMTIGNNYKYWAICTNDKFQNIVGWCGLSWEQVDDYKERTARTRTLVIYDPKYRDTVAWFLACEHLLNYAFNEVKADRLFGDCLTTQPFHYQVLKSLPYISIEEKENVLVRNGQSHDYVSFLLYREDYEKMKNQGYFDYEHVQGFLKNQVKGNDSEKLFVGIDDFIKEFMSLLDSTNHIKITPETKFRDLDDWSSLLAIDLVAVAEKGFHTTFDMSELNKCDTIQDLYEIIKKRGE